MGVTHILPCVSGRDGGAFAKMFSQVEGVTKFPWQNNNNTIQLFFSSSERETMYGPTTLSSFLVVRIQKVQLKVLGPH